MVLNRLPTTTTMGASRRHAAVLALYHLGRAKLAVEDGWEIVMVRPRRTSTTEHHTTIVNADKHTLKEPNREPH
jgi:hypothetical protein